MASFISPTTVHDKLTRLPDGSSVRKARVFTYACTAVGDFTIPLDLHGAKNVWVTDSNGEACSYWVPAYADGEINTSSYANYKELVPNANVVVTGAKSGVITSAALPAYLSVKHTGATASATITILVTY